MLDPNPSLLAALNWWQEKQIPIHELKMAVRGMLSNSDKEQQLYEEPLIGNSSLRRSGAEIHHIESCLSPFIEEDDDGHRTPATPFPMSRIRRLIHNEGEVRTTQDAVFLINNAVEQFVKLLAEDSYSCIKPEDTSVTYKHLSSVVRRDRRYEFLADFVPEKLRAEVALLQQPQPDA